MKNSGRLILRSHDDKKPTFVISEGLKELFPIRGIYNVSMRVEEQLHEGQWYHSNDEGTTMRAKEWNRKEFPLPAIPAKNGGLWFNITKAVLFEADSDVKYYKDGERDVVSFNSYMKVQKLREVKTPVRGTELSAGIDFFVPKFNNLFIMDVMLKSSDISEQSIIDKTIALHPGENILIPSGIRVEVPKNKVLIGFNKSGVASKLGLLVGAQVIDEDYRGEIHLNLHNASNVTVFIEEDKKLVQFILSPVVYCGIEVVEKISTTTERGEGGFGHTDKK